LKKYHAGSSSGESYMKLKKSEVRIEPLNLGYIITVTDGLIWPSTQDLAVTRDELKEIVMQALPYLWVLKGTKVVELKKK